jgi:hypothetical protein
MISVVHTRAALVLAESDRGSNLPASHDHREDCSIVHMYRSRPQLRHLPHRALRSTVRAVLLVCGLLMTMIGSVTGQVVRGSVHSRAISEGIAGTVLLLVDSANAITARALADEHGDYVLYAPTRGRYQIRALRIGFRPMTSAPFSLAGDTTIAIRMVDLPLDLPAVTTREQTQCAVRPDSGLALAALWEDAKTALLATAITRDDAKYRFDLTDHTRIYDFKTRELLDVDLKEATVYDTHSWVSAPPERLHRDGYVIERRDSATFIAPDIETLLSEYFVSTHCFRIGTQRGDADPLIAVEFDPASRAKHVEVRGTLWLDRRTHELCSLDFNYVNLDLPMAGADSAAGGHVGFARLPTGAWVVTDWAIRVPVAHVASEQGSPPALRRIGGPVLLLHRHPVIDELHVSGGTLRDVSRDGTLVWSRGRHSIELHVMSANTRADRPAEQAAVFLVGSQRRFVLADSLGDATVDDLLPGAYLIEVATRELDILGAARTRVRVDVDSISVPATDVRVKSSLDAARAVCLDDTKSLNDGTGVIVGDVRRGDEPLSGRAVSVSWIGEAAGAHSPGSIITRNVRTLASDGRFLACGVPRNRPIEIRVAGDDAAPTIARLTTDQVVGIVSVVLKPEP